MQRIWKLLVFMVAGLLVLVACGGAVEETAVSDTPASDTPETAVESEPVPVVERPAGQEINGYVNVSYTEANAELVGNTNRLQMLSVYSTW